MTAAKIKLIANPRYQKSGTKSYVYLMRKYGFHPTKEGPYQIGTVMQQTGRQYTDKPVGGRVYFRQVLQKKSVDTNELARLVPTMSRMILCIWRKLVLVPLRRI